MNNSFNVRFFYTKRNSVSTQTPNTENAIGRFHIQLLKMLFKRLIKCSPALKKVVAVAGDILVMTQHLKIIFKMDRPLNANLL